MLVQSSESNKLSAPKLSRFEPLNRNDPRLTSKLDTKIVAGENSCTHLNAVKLITIDDENKERVIRVSDVASFQNQDTCDVLPWCKIDNEFYIGYYEALRPVEAARDLFGARSKFNGIFPQLPGGYLLPGNGDAWIDRAVSQVCAEKVGAQPIALPSLLGGGYFTSIGAHTEGAILVEVEVAPPPQLEQMRFGEGFHQSIVSRFVKPQEIIDRFFNGEIPDIRLLEATFRFCERNKIKLHLPFEISTNSAEPSDSSDLPKLQKFSASQLRRESEKPQPNWQVSTDSNSELSGFLRTDRIMWQGQNSEGKVVVNEFADSISRGGQDGYLDTFDVGCYFWENDKIYLVVQRGAREAIGFRNTLAHSIKTDCSLFHNDGISGSLLQNDTSPDARKQAVLQTVREKTGCEPISEPVEVGFYYPSSGFSTEGTYGNLIEIDPTQVLPSDNQVFAVELNDLLELSDQGYFRDVRLSALAHILSHSNNYPRRKHKDHDPLVIEQFNSVLSSGVELQHFLQSNAPQIYSDLVKIPEYRRLIAYAINEFGGAIREYSDPEERFLFRAAFPVFTYYQSPRDSQEWSLRVLHDTAHFIMMELSPYLHTADGKLQRDSLGNPKMRDPEEFTEWYTRSECKAVGISDAILARNSAASFSWRARSAEVFAILGVSEPDQIFKLIEEIELNGRIPAWVLKHPRYAECRDVIVGTLLQFGALDHAQLQIFHKDMVEFPEVAETLAQFGRISTSVKEYAERVSTSYEKVVAYGEGVNPVKAQLNMIAYAELLPQAIRIACVERFLKNNTDQSGAIEECEEIRGAILSAFKQVKKLADQLRTIEPNDSRLQNYERVLKIKTPVLQAANNALDKFIPILPQAARDLMQTRELPCFHSQKGIDFEAAKKRALENEKISFAAAGLKFDDALPAPKMWS